MEKMVKITKEEYESLLEDRNLLRALKAAGVDNWEGYGVALELYEDEFDAVGDKMARYYLLDGRIMKEEDLIRMYKYNFHHGLIPTTGYFCPKCNREVELTDRGNCGCKHCGYRGMPDGDGDEI